MAAIFLVQNHYPAFRDEALAVGRDQFEQHGFREIREFAVGDWTLLHAPHIIGGPESLLVRGDNLVAVAGTLVCDGRMGVPALEAMLDLALVPQPDWSRIGGQFVALVRTNGRTFLFTDFFGAFQIFHDAEMRFFSTSLLAATRVLPRVSFDRQSVYEFAFNAAPIGDDTIFSEIKCLGPDRLIELGTRSVTCHPLRNILPERTERLPVEARISIHRRRLMNIVEPHVATFGSHIYCPLSGGLDSRLVLAALRASGSKPRPYVYGSADTADVKVARAIADAEGVGIDWIDKEHWRDITPDAFPEQVAHNFQVYDGTPNFGDLFENGANHAARNARHADGALSASGGCGEIFRNFFFLPNRSLAAADVVRSFFARYIASDTTELFDEREFLHAMTEKVLAALNRTGDHGRLPRTLIEQVYPRIRCRALFGKEISMEARYGAYLMPFLDHHLVAEALTLPLALKNAGRFEAMLLASIDPGLAARPSSYGHDFTGPPSVKHRFGEWSTRIRPTWLRQKSYGLRRRMGPVADEHGGLLTSDYMGKVVDLEFPVMRRFFRTEQIADSSIMRRIANLEYFASWLGSRLGA